MSHFDGFENDPKVDTRRQRGMNRQKKHQNRTRKKWVKRTSFLTLALIVGFAVYFVGQIWGALLQGHDEKVKGSDLRDKKVNISKDPSTILFIGTDQYDVEAEKQQMRTDVLMVAAINPKKHSVKLVSIPRDTYAEIANTNGFKTKINASAYWGKQKGINPIKNTMRTVEKLLNGVPIDYYVKINFKGFIDIVDAVGGVDVNVKKSFSISTFGSKVVHFEKGPMHLTGEEALPYVRMRKQDPLGDKGRNKRQQEVISDLLDKMVSFNSVTKIGEITDAVGENLSYSIPPSEFLALSDIYKKIPKENIQTISTKTRPEKIDGISYLLMSDEERERLSNILKKQLELPVEEENSEGENSQGEGNSPDQEGDGESEDQNGENNF